VSLLDFHVLLSLAKGPLYGYAIAEAVEADSGGTLTPKAGSLYRVIARLETSGLVDETEPKSGTPAHPGRERRYYQLTRSGRSALAAEASRLNKTAAYARRRLGIAGERS
jgi:DNA-binding PadR family transcriptional regulator